jgi:glycosyltransferase involved in cell wall biosynthesis
MTESKFTQRQGDPLTIAMLAPPWISIPPPGYGGIEQVVDLLASELIRRGHAVTLFAAAESRSPAEVKTVLDHQHPDEIQMSIYEADHVARAFDDIDAAAAGGHPYDIVHDHAGFTAFAFAGRLDTPLVHTLHGPFTNETSAFYARNAGKAWALALSEYQRSQAPPELDVAAVVHNPIVVDDFPFRDEKDDYLLFIGRMNDEKGPQRAIAAARRAGMRLLLAGPVQPGQEEFFGSEVEPHLGDDAVEYIGEIGEEKLDLYAGAAALLMPIRWPEPFGLVMTEAMACGTPVIAFPEGSATEIVLDGETGFVVDDEEAMGEAARKVDSIDPHRCRESADERFDVAAVASKHEDAYRQLIDSRASEPTP